MLRPCFRLGHTYAGNGWIAENRRWNAVIIDRARIVPEHAVGKGMAFTDGNRRQLHAIGDVTNGVNAGNIGAVVVTDLHRSVFAKVNANLL
jgi:hypothetical protein